MTRLLTASLLSLGLIACGANQTERLAGRTEGTTYEVVVPRPPAGEGGPVVERAQVSKVIYIGQDKIDLPHWPTIDVNYFGGLIHHKATSSVKVTE